MHNDDSMIGRLLTRRELVALFGASAVAAMTHRVSGQAAKAGAESAGLPACVVVPQQTEGPGLCRREAAAIGHSCRLIDGRGQGRRAAGVGDQGLAGHARGRLRSAPWRTGRLVAVRRDGRLL